MGVEMLKTLAAAISVIAILSHALAKAPPSSAWTVGQEREVDEGWYAKLVYQANGWRLWRFETRQGVSCYLVKPANGRVQPYPLGVGNSFYQGTPRVQIYYEGQKPTRVSLVGAESTSRAEWRMPGERFWTGWTWESYPDIAALDGKTIEVHVQGWEYPELRVGLSDERGLLNLTGAKVAMAAAEGCK